MKANTFSSPDGTSYVHLAVFLIYAFANVTFLKSGKDSRINVT